MSDRHLRSRVSPGLRFRPTPIRVCEQPRGPQRTETQVLALRQAELRSAAVKLQPRLLRYVMRFTGQGPEFAHDVVQDSLVAAWCNLDRIRDDRHLRPWLCRVVRFKAVDRLRRRGPGGQPMLSLDTGGAFGADQEDELEGKRPPTALPVSGNATLLRLIAELPANYIGAVRLHYLHGLSVRETADLLSLPRSTVKMRLYRARERLRRALQSRERSATERD